MKVDFDGNMDQDSSNPQDILKLAGENRPVERAEIGIELLKTDNTVQGGHVMLTFNYDGKDDKKHQTYNGSKA